MDKESCEPRRWFLDTLPKWEDMTPEQWIEEFRSRDRGNAITSIQKVLKLCDAYELQRAELEAIKAKSPSYDALLIIAQSVCGALERAGLTDCDDPGEAIDVIREKRDRRIATLESELEAMRKGEGEPVAQRVLDANGVPCKVFGGWVEYNSHKCAAGEFVLREGCRFEYAYRLASPQVTEDEVKHALFRSGSDPGSTVLTANLNAALAQRGKGS